MASLSAAMLEPLLWLTPISKDFLRATSKGLRGAIPSSAGALAKSLAQAEDCEGILCNAAFRHSMAKELESLGTDVSDAAVPALVDSLGKVLMKEIEAIKKAASSVKGKLPKQKKGASMPGFSSLSPLQADSKSQILSRDWLIWHAVGNAHDAGLVSPPPDGVLAERAAVAACCPDGPVGESALVLHTLENVGEYVKWELSLPGSKPPASGIEVLCPFDDKVATEVAIRRVLTSVLAPDVALAVIEEAAGDVSKIPAALKTLAQSAKAQAVIPIYAAPPAPKEPKGAKEPKDKKGKKDDAGGAKAAAAAVPGDASSFDKLHVATASQELQWHLLTYSLDPATALSRTMVESPNEAVKPSPKKVAKTESGAKAGAAVSKPSGFAGLWAEGGLLPPGHTEYSWTSAGGTAQREVFQNLWSNGSGDVLPPGHTEYSWEQAASSAPATAAPASGGKPAAAKASAAKAKGAPAKAESKAPSAGAVPQEGSDEEALCKLDFRCGRILSCERVPDADTLYLLKIDVGDPEPRQVVSSLVKFYKAEQLANRDVVVYCNIKPGKMRGFESQAMVLAATANKGADNEQCELLTPPEGTQAGTRVQYNAFEVGCLSDKQSLKNISKVWGAVQPSLQTSAKLQATFKGAALTMNGANITVPSLGGVGIY